MSARILGVPCTVTRRDASHAKNAPVLDAPLSWSPAAQDLGPAGDTLSLRTWFEGAGMLQDSRDLAERIKANRFATLVDPAGTWYDEGAAILKVKGHPWTQQGPRFAFVDIQATFLGTPATHRFRFSVTSHQLPNAWAQAGRTMVRVPPAFQVESPALHVADQDAARGVWRDLYFATQNAVYEADATDRSGPEGIPAHLATPGNELGECVRAVVAGRDWHGPRDLTGATVRSVAQDVIFAAGAVTIRDRLGIPGAADRTLTVGAWARAAHGGTPMPATPQRHDVVLDNGAVVSVQDNGNTYVRPLGQALTAPGGAARALGTGEFWHSLGGSAYLVGTVDFSVDGAGAVDYDEDPDAVFGVIHTDLAGAARLDRLREFFAETLVDWLPEAR